jgi:UDP-GlcNAc3NAcA epimerase
MRVVSVVGARPNFIKAAMVSRALRECPGVSEAVIHTGQHYDADMSGVFFEELGLRDPDWNLEIGSGPHGRQTGRMLEAIESVLLSSSEMPDWVVVHGDTNSTIAGALAAAKIGIKVAHVEAGLRTYNRENAEEMNRVLTDHISDVLFAPTAIAADNLLREGIASARVDQVGDVMYDAVLHFREIAEERSTILPDLGLTMGGYVLATIHRAENTDSPGRLEVIFDALQCVARTLPVVLPLHPRTRAALARDGALAEVTSALMVTNPLGYLDMLTLERNAALVCTDSGGVQKEAFFHGTPAVVLDFDTDWGELVEAGWNTLAPPTHVDSVVSAVHLALHRRGTPVDAFGRGNAAALIARRLCEGMS